MLFLSFLLQQLNKHVVFVTRNQSQSTCPARLDFIDKQKTLTSDRTWIGSGEQTLKQLDGITIEPGTVIFISDYESNTQDTEELPGTTLVCVNCSLAILYNVINNALCDIRLWSDQYFSASDQSLFAMIELTAKLSSASVLLLNPNYRIILSSGLDDSIFLSEQLTTAGTLSEQTIDTIFAEESDSHNPIMYSVPDSELSLYGLKIFHEEKLISVLILEDCSKQTGIDFLGLCACAGKALYRHIIPTNTVRLGTYTKKFHEFWQEIMTQQLTQNSEIHQILERLPFPTEAFVRVIIVTFETSNTGQIPFSFILARLREVFPECNMAVYENEVIILQTYSERCFELNLDTERLTSILERHKGFAGISNGTRNYGTLRSLYLLAKGTITIASELRKNTSERIYSHEDYWVYTAIDMCVHRFLELHHHDDIVYLIHPAVIHIMRYDKQHNTNLRDTLFYYLLNDRNLVKTAAVTFSHRNTVINKVNKINKLICLDLEDGNLRQRLIFSCQIIRYYEEYMKKDLVF